MVGAGLVADSFSSNIYLLLLADDTLSLKYSHIFKSNIGTMSKIQLKIIILLCASNKK